MRFTSSKKAASTTEYGLLLGLLAVGLIVAVRATGVEVDQTLSRVTDQLNEVESPNKGSGDTSQPTPTIPASCKEIIDNNSAAASGSYQIDPDGDGGNAPFSAICDMTYNGGGWTKIIAGASTSLADITRFPHSGNDIATGFINGPLGVSWGTANTTDTEWNDNTSNAINFTISYNEVYLTASGYYNIPANSLAQLNILNGAGTMLYRSADPWDAAASGQRLSVNGSQIFNLSQTNIVDRSDILTAGGPGLIVKMNGYRNFPYSRRYIRDLWYR